MVGDEVPDEQQTTDVEPIHDDEVPQHENQPEQMPPQGPPRDEPGIPALQMFAADAAELQRNTTPNNLVTIQSNLLDRFGFSAFGVTSNDGAQGQAGLSYNTRFGVLKAEMISMGVVQTSLEGLQLLPFTNISTQLAFMNRQLCMGGLQAALVTGIGVGVASVNLAGQMSAELVTGMMPSEENRLILGTHIWGLPGQYGGMMAAFEWQKAVMDGEDLKELSTRTMACTRPHEGSTAGSSATLTATHRTAGNHVLMSSFTSSASKGSVLSFGGSRQLHEGVRFHGRWSSSGVLGLALEVSGPQSRLCLFSEANPSGVDLSPKFGISVDLTP